ncbi:MAG: helix-turn-helix domain-containing protein [Phycisphaerae bacterium]|nr:helix-turn-helix domain-containing protein [Phycisphaerae bacterium]
MFRTEHSAFLLRAAADFSDFQLAKYTDLLILRTKGFSEVFCFAGFSGHRCPEMPYGGRTPPASLNARPAAAQQRVRSVPGDGGSGEYIVKRKAVYTTGEAATICHLSQQTIIRCFDNGHLGGFRVPGSRFRRIPHEDLVAFMRVNGIPLGPVASEHINALVVAADVTLRDLLQCALQHDDRFEPSLGQTSFDAGVMAERFAPTVVIVEHVPPRIDACQICRGLQKQFGEDDIIAVVVNPGSDEHALRELGVSDFHTTPFDIEALIERLAESGKD